jgi:hypothetical protein
MRGVEVPPVHHQAEIVWHSSLRHQEEPKIPKEKQKREATNLRDNRSGNLTPPEHFHQTAYEKKRQKSTTFIRSK